LHFYSLKDVAALLGFTWRESGVVGVNAVRWYEEYLSSRHKNLLDRIVSYNEDDCRATERVKHWAAEQAAD
jgi:uncharacterized protein